MREGTSSRFRRALGSRSALLAVCAAVGALTLVPAAAAAAKERSQLVSLFGDTSVVVKKKKRGGGVSAAFRFRCAPEGLAFLYPGKRVVYYTEGRCSLAMRRIAVAGRLIRNGRQVGYFHDAAGYTDFFRQVRPYYCGRSCAGIYRYFGSVRFTTGGDYYFDRADGRTCQIQRGGRELFCATSKTSSIR